MTVITTKYSIGDTVFHAGISMQRQQHPCPDCLGERTWKAISPAGQEYSFNCPRCFTNFINDQGLSLEYSAYTACVAERTIGSVRFDTHSHWDGSPRGPEYMCNETGVGGGTVYRETDLFVTREEAQQVAELRALKQNETSEPIVNHYNKTLKISEYQLSDAKLKLAEDRQFQNRSLLWNIESMMSEVMEARDLETAREAVDTYKTFDFDHDREKLRKAVLGECEAAEQEAAHAPA